MKNASDLIDAYHRLGPVSRQKVRDAIGTELQAGHQELLTDAEAAAMLRIKPDTFTRHLRNGPPRKRSRDVLDLRLIRCIHVGGSRRWSRESILKALRGEDQ